MYTHVIYVPHTHNLHVRPLFLMIIRLWHSNRTSRQSQLLGFRLDEQSGLYDSALRNAFHRAISFHTHSGSLRC
jgi:hypothetical protein